MFAQVHVLSPIWPLVAPMVAEAVSHSSGRFDAQDIRDLAESGRFQLWVHNDGCAIDLVLVTEVVAWPRRKALSVVLLTGEHREKWLSYLPELEKFAKSQGCDLIEAWARPGWERVAKWRKTHVLLERDIAHV